MTTILPLSPGKSDSYAGKKKKFPVPNHLPITEAPKCFLIPG